MPGGTMWNVAAITLLLSTLAVATVLMVLVRLQQPPYTGSNSHLGGRFPAAVGSLKNATLFLSRSGSSLSESTPKSTLVLHSGPHKMGTTYLQCALQSDLAKKYLDQDAYVYLGKRNEPCGGHGADFGDVSRVMDPKRPLHVSQEFVNTMNDLHRSGRNAIIVTESWHPLRDSQYRAIAAALSEDWTIQHIVAYRPIYEWLPSFYSERFRPLYLPRYDWNGSGTKTWGEIPAMTLKASDAWSYGFYNALKFLRTHPTRLVMDRVTRLLPGNGNISVVDMTDLPHDALNLVGDAYLVQILCHEVADTPNACRAARTSADLSVVQKPNPSYHVDADRLASAALYEGIFSPKTDRVMITKRTHDRLENLLASGHYSSPNRIRTCPSRKSLNSLLTLSLEMEEQVFDVVLTKERQRRHENGFDKESESGQLCALDTDKLLADSAWVAFFESLSAPW